MPTHTETRILPYTAAQMHALVIDVAKYPEFLPWCQATRVYDVRQNAFTADVLIGYKMLRERYSCDVRYETPTLVDVSYRSGPFQHLDTRWNFADSPQGCTIHFAITFEFKSRFLQKVATSLFHEVVKRMVAAFEGRARVLYGETL